MSRCQRYDFTRITADDIAGRLLYVAGQEKMCIRDRVSTAVGNSAGAPIHTPPCAAKADPNAMRLPTSEEQPPEPYC